MLERCRQCRHQRRLHRILLSRIVSLPGDRFFLATRRRFLLPGVPGNDDGKCQGILVEDYRQHCCIGVDAGNAHPIVGG